MLLQNFLRVWDENFLETLDENFNNSAIFGAKTSRFCMDVNLDNTYNMLMMMMTIIMVMIMIMMMIIAVTQSISVLGPPHFAWK